MSRCAATRESSGAIILWLHTQPQGKLFGYLHSIVIVWANACYIRFFHNRHVSLYAWLTAMAGLNLLIPQRRTYSGQRDPSKKGHRQQYNRFPPGEIEPVTFRRIRTFDYSAIWAELQVKGADVYREAFFAAT